MFMRLKKAGFTLIELAVIVAIIITFIILLTPIIGRIRTRAELVTCEENLQKIGLGLKLYANEHQGKFPPSLSELIEDGYVEDERVFDCPSNRYIGDVLEPDYHYTTGHSISSSSDTAIVFDKITNHRDGKHVLYISGDIVWEEK